MQPGAVQRRNKGCDALFPAQHEENFPCSSPRQAGCSEKSAREATPQRQELASMHSVPQGDAERSSDVLTSKWAVRKASP